MTRILTMIAAIAILILLVLWLRNPDPADETDLPAVDAPNISLESNLKIPPAKITLIT